MPNKLLSVIMPAKDLHSGCLPSINSILTQEAELELVIVVDGGQQSIDIDDDRVKIINLKENVGPGAATNIGYSYCRGDLITVHDADDISKPGRFRLLLDNMNSDVITSYVEAIKDNKIIKIKKSNPSSIILPADYYKRIKIKTPAHHCATIMTRSLWDKIGPYYELSKIAADSQRMIKLGIYKLLLGDNSFEVLDKSLYEYYIHESSHSRKNNVKFDKQVRTQRAPIKKYWHLIKNMKPDEFLDYWNNTILKK